MANILSLPSHEKTLLDMLSPRLRRLLRPVIESAGPRVQEIRIAQGRPVIIRTERGERYLSAHGLAERLDEAIVAGDEMIRELLDAVTASSVYALEDAMREGFIPLPGGHRVGLAGEARTEGGRIVGFRHVTGFNIRLNHDLRGVARPLLRSLARPDGRVWSTLVVSPPGAGKTTLLRDLIRALSYGAPQHGLAAHRVGVADERGELAGGYRGVAQNDLGPRTDVIEMGPKRFALAMLVRTMAPDVVVTDEIGHPGDGQAILDAVTAGVSLICSAHAACLGDLQKRPAVRPLLDAGVFQRVVVLSRRLGPGTVEQVVACEGEP